ncbi:MAG: hypothetical protein ACK50N_04445 [Flavobacteriales bacterium]|jgi:hypothetical protein
MNQVEMSELNFADLTDMYRKIAANIEAELPEVKVKYTLIEE